MIGFSLIIALTAPAGIHCPPDAGQIRWDAVQYGFEVKIPYSVRGTAWDRDHSGTVSKGDVFRVDAAWAQGKPLPFEQTWLVLGEKLATDIQAGLAKAGDAVVMSCESTLAINEEPQVVADARGLAKHLAAALAPIREENVRLERMAADMKGWAVKICKDGKYKPSAQIAELLVGRAAKPYGDLGARRIRDAADDTSRSPDLSCTKLTQGKISFD